MKEDEIIQLRIAVQIKSDSRFGYIKLDTHYPIRSPQLSLKVGRLSKATDNITDAATDINVGFLK